MAKHKGGKMGGKGKPKISLKGDMHKSSGKKMHGKGGM
jgi:hypothetical protein